MKTRIPSKTMWLIVALLVAVCAAQGYYIYAQRTSPKPEEPKSESPDSKLFSEMRKRMYRGYWEPFRMFDRMFPEQLFTPRFDPFSDADQLHRGWSPLFRNEAGSPLMTPWRDMFGGALEAETINPEIKSTKDEVVVSLRIPGLEKESLNIDIKEGRIRISYSAREVSEEKGAQGKSYRRSESVRQFQKIMPIPAEADPDTGQVSQEGKIIKITFKKRSPG